MSTNNIGRRRPEEDTNILSHASLGVKMTVLSLVTDRFGAELLSSNFNSPFVDSPSLLRGRNRSLPKAQQGQDGVGATTCGGAGIYKICIVVRLLSFPQKKWIFRV